MKKENNKLNINKIFIFMANNIQNNLFQMNINNKYLLNKLFYIFLNYNTNIY